MRCSKGTCRRAKCKDVKDCGGDRLLVWMKFYSKCFCYYNPQPGKRIHVVRRGSKLFIKGVVEVWHSLPHQYGIFLAEVVFPLIEDNISSLVVSIFSNLIWLIWTHIRSNPFSENKLIKLSVLFLSKYRCIKALVSQGISQQIKRQVTFGMGFILWSQALHFKYKLPAVSLSEDLTVSRTNIRSSRQSEECTLSLLAAFSN